MDGRNLHGAAHPVNPHQLPAVVPAGRARALEAAEPFPWQQALRVRRSKQGMNAGVYFVEAETRTIVVKSSRAVGAELLPARLARLVGLPGPSPYVESRLPQQLRAKINARGPEHRKVLVMARVQGQSFNELNDDHRAVVLGGGGGGRAGGLLPAIGGVLAFDYFIRNPDRFPCRGLDGCNTGNLMLDGSSLQVIDSTLPQLVPDQEARAYHRRLSDILRLVKDPHHREADHHLSPITAFFPAHWQVAWTDIRAHIVAGFSAQARVIAQLSRAEVKACVREARGHGAIDSRQEAALYAQLDLFKLACR